MLSLKLQAKLDDAKTDLRVYCKCGHSIFMPIYLKHTICRYCGSKVYRNKKEEFKEKMALKLKRI